MWLRKVFFILLGISYIILGLFVFIKKVIVAPWGIVFSVACIVYGSWRIYRAYHLKNGHSAQDADTTADE